MGMADWFRRNWGEDEDDRLEREAGLRAQREEQILKDVCQAIDIINSNLPFLPRGVYPWMSWRPSPRLTLVARAEIDREVLHGDGLTRMEFD